MDAIVSPRRSKERPLLLTERDLTRADIAQMADERERFTILYESDLCKMIEARRIELERQRKLVAEVRDEADRLEALRRSMAADDLVWCSLRNGSRQYRKLTPDDVRKEGVC